MRRCAVLLAFVMVLLAGLIPSVQGSQVLYMSPQALGQGAGLVVRGTVQSVESYWNNRHTKIFTRTRLTVDETYKGSSSPAIDVIQLGGVVGRVKITAQGALAWQEGEEALLFLEPCGASGFQVSGFSQGKFKIVRDPLTHAAYIEEPPQEGVELLGAPPSSGRARPVPERRLTLEQFISQALGAGGTPGVGR